MPISSGAGGTPTSYFRGKPDGKPAQDAFTHHQPQYVQRRGSARIPPKTVRVVRVQKKRGCFKGMFKSRVWRAGHPGYSADALGSGPVNCYGLGMCLLALLLLGLLAAIATAIYYAISATQAAQIKSQLSILQPGHQEKDRFFYVANYDQKCVSRVTGNVITVPATVPAVTVAPTVYVAPTVPVPVVTVPITVPVITTAQNTATTTTGTGTTPAVATTTTTVKTTTTTVKTTTPVKTTTIPTTPPLMTTTLPFCDTITYTYTEVYPITPKSNVLILIPSTRSIFYGLIFCAMLMI